MEQKTLNEHIKEILKILGKILEEELKQLMIQRGKLLKNGGLVESIEYKVTEDNGLKLIAEEYFEYYINGRKPGARKVPIYALLKWIKRYKSKIGQFRDKKGRYISDNSMAFAIQTAIFKNGILRKTYIDTFFTLNEKLVNDIIVEEISKFLEKKVEDSFPEKIG